MKKLLATMLLSLGATVAWAQSSVTVYGILDVGYSGVSTRSGSTKTQTNKFDQSAESPSRLGFKGVEDLGGGTSAFFMVEMALYPQDATLSGNGKNGLVNRQTYVGFKQAGIGQAAVGTQYTPMFVQQAKTDPGQANDVVGSVIYPSNGSAGISTSAYTLRASNALTFQTENYKGLGFSGMYSANNKDTTQTGANTGGNTNVNGYSLNANYTLGKSYSTLVYQSFRNENPSATVTPVATSMTNNNGSNVTSNEFYAGTSYDFGPVKGFANYISRRVTSVLDSSQYLNRTAQQLGVRGFVTPKIEAWASAGNGRYTAFGAGSPTANFVGYQVGSNYWLSKRTNLYAILGDSHTTSSDVVSAGATQYAMGVRHTF